MKTVHLVISILACLFFLPVSSQNTWTPFTSPTPQQTEINLIVSDNSSVEFNVEVFGMYENDTTISGTNFQRIIVPGGTVTVTTGEPEMPYIRQLIAIPHCENVNLSVNITGSLSFSNYYIYPAPDYAEVINPDSSVYLEEVFSYDTNAYLQNQNYPQPTAEIKSTGFLRDQMYAEVYIYPVQFNPTTGNLQVNSNYEITLTFTNPGGPVNENTGIFNNVASNVFLNYVSSGITAKINDRPGHTGNIEWIELTEQGQADDIVADYLIITDDLFWDPSGQTTDLLRIAQHRAEYNGFDIAIVKVEQVMEVYNIPGEDYEFERAIRRFIKAVYEGENANNTYDGKLGYVLLVGEATIDSVDGIPASYDLNPGALFQNNNPSSVYPSDYYYSCLNSDNGIYDDVGELYVGRFSVDDAYKLHNIVEKTIYHEREYVPEGGAGGDTVFFANSSFLQALQYLPLYHSWLDNIIQNPYYNKFYSTPELPSPPSLYDFLDTLNAGCIAMFYYGHSDINKYEIWGIPFNQYVTTEYLMENLSNKGKYPFVANHSCNTGKYDNLVGECMAETMISYSDTCGYLATLASGRLFWLNHGTPPNIITAIQEIMPLSIWQHQSHILGEFILESKVANESLRDNFALNLFGDPALNLMAEGFEITNSMTLLCPTIISSEIFVRTGAELTIPANCHIDFVDNGKLIIDYDANLIIGQGTVFTGINPQNRIDVYGDVEFRPGDGGPVTFTAPENHSWAGLSISNTSASIEIQTPLLFKNCNFTSHTDILTISPLIVRNSFENTSFNYSHGSLILHNTDFVDTEVFIIQPEDNNSSVEISNCTFNNENNVYYASILIEQYKQYNIHDNTINFNIADGITIFNCGGISEYNFTNNITNNDISYIGSNQNLNKGIKIYRSIANIENNNIINTDFGIVGLNNSIVSIMGDWTATVPSETQNITNNISYQLYFSNNSFPTDIHFNVISNGVNTNPLVYNDVNPPTGKLFDVEFNCWDTSFVGQNDLIPQGYYDWDPEWCPGTTTSSANNSADIVLYESAMLNVETGNYTTADSEFKQIISDYPETETAINTIKQLYELEDIAGQDYQSLKNYYEAEPNLQNNDKIGKLTDWMISYCDVRLENYQDAIDWYDNVIDTANFEEDSTFAAIDMGEAYLAMGTGMKSTVNCKNNQFLFDSRKAFAINRDYLIDELLKSNKTNASLDPVSDEFEENKSAILHQNIPNPFNSTTTIMVELIKESNITLEIFNYSGKLISTLTESNYIAGLHKFIFNTQNFNEGLYLYSLKVDGIFFDSKKMLLIK
jgi:tetratricopeptide (TPR) repeat protein